MRKALAAGVRVLEDMAKGRVPPRDYAKVLKGLERQFPSDSADDDSYDLWHETFQPLRRQILSHLNAAERKKLDRAMGWDAPVPKGYVRIRE